MGQLLVAPKPFLPFFCSNSTLPHMPAGQGLHFPAVLSTSLATGPSKPAPRRRDTWNLFTAFYTIPHSYDVDTRRPSSKQQSTRGPRLLGFPVQPFLRALVLNS